MKSISKTNKIKNLLNKKIKKNNLYEKLLTEESTYASLSVGDLFYDYLRVNPEYVKTLDVIHPNDEIGNAIEAGWYKKNKFDEFEKNSANPEKSWAGHENRDFGYSGERYFGQQFQNQNAEVEYPSSLNNPGWDLKVNGVEVQSKIGSSKLIDQHFKKYPAEEYPERLVVANSEAVNDYISRHPEHADKIIDGGPIEKIKQQYFDSSYSAKEIFEDEDFFSIPIAESISIGLIIAAGKNSYKFLQNKKNFSEAVVDTGIDAATRAGAIGLSASAGSLLIGALSGGPYGIIAGKFVGGVLGLYPGRKISTFIKHNIRCKDEQINLEKNIKEYLQRLYQISLSNSAVFENKVDLLEKYLSNKNETISEVWEFIKLKIDDERKYKKNIIDKIQNSINDINDLNQKAEYISQLADEAVFLGNKIGIGPIFLKKEAAKLITSAKKYNKCIEKII